MKIFKIKLVIILCSIILPITAQAGMTYSMHFGVGGPTGLATIIVVNGFGGSEVDRAPYVNKGYNTVTVAVDIAETMNLDALWHDVKKFMKQRKSTCVATQGGSWGNMIAIYLATQIPEITAVFARVPTSGAVSVTANASSIMFNQQHVPHAHAYALADGTADAAAYFQVEKIAGPVHMVGGLGDFIWPSDIMVGQMRDRLKKYNFPFYNNMEIKSGSHGASIDNFFTKLNDWRTTCLSEGHGEKVTPININPIKNTTASDVGERCLSVNDNLEVIHVECNEDDKKQQWSQDNRSRVYNIGTEKCLTMNTWEASLNSVPKVRGCNRHDLQKFKRNTFLAEIPTLLKNVAYSLCLTSQNSYLDPSNTEKGLVTYTHCGGNINQNYLFPPSKAFQISRGNKCLRPFGDQLNYNNGTDLFFLPDCPLHNANTLWIFNEASGSIIHKETGKCIDAHQPDYLAKRNGTRVQLWDCNGSEQQRFSPKESFLIMPNGMCLDSPFLESAPFFGIYRAKLWSCDSNNKNQQFDFLGAYDVQIKASNGKCLAPTGGDNGYAINYTRCNHNEPNTYWLVDNVRNNLIHRISGKCYDAHAPDHHARRYGTKVQLWDCNGSVQQQISHGGDAQQQASGGANLLKTPNNLCLDVHAGQWWWWSASTSLWGCHGGVNQKWHYKKVN